MILECPHCHLTVMPLGDGECPACHNNTQETAGANPNATLLYVSEATKFPAACCSCNRPTDSLVRVTRAGQVATSNFRGPSNEGLWIVSLVSVVIFGLIGILFLPFVGRGRKSVGQTSMTLHLPQCASCSSTIPIEPEVVDLEHYQLGIIVDRKFAEQVKELNRRYR